MEELRKLALETARGDAAAADSLLAEVAALSPDQVEQLRLLEERARVAAAARRVEAWKSLKEKPAVLAVPVILAFAIGLTFGGGLGLVRVAPAATEVSLPVRSVVVAHQGLERFVPIIDGAPRARTLAVLGAGQHRIEPRADWVEIVPVPDTGSHGLLERAGNLDGYAAWRAFQDVALIDEAFVQGPGGLGAAAASEVQTQLDRRCSELVAQGDFEQIRAEFPNPDQRCFYEVPR